MEFVNSCHSALDGCHMHSIKAVLNLTHLQGLHARQNNSLFLFENYFVLVCYHSSIWIPVSHMRLSSSFCHLVADWSITMLAQKGQTQNFLPKQTSVCQKPDNLPKHKLGLFFLPPGGST